MYSPVTDALKLLNINEKVKQTNMQKHTVYKVTYSCNELPDQTTTFLQGMSPSKHKLKPRKKSLIFEVIGY